MVWHARLRWTFDAVLITIIKVYETTHFDVMIWRSITVRVLIATVLWYWKKCWCMGSCNYTICITDVSGLIWDTEDSFCVMRREDYCPDKDIRFFLYTRYVSWVGFSKTWFEDFWAIFFYYACSEQRTRREIDTSFKYSLLKYGWNPKKKNVIVIHGFNGTEGKSPMTIIRDGKCKERRKVFQGRRHRNWLLLSSLVAFCYYFTQKLLGVTFFVIFKLWKINEKIEKKL